jgi:hypothetical protein
MAQFGTPGTVVITNQTDAAIGPSGKPIRIFSISVLSGGTAAVVKLFNGTDASGVIWLQVDGTINKAVTVDFANGILFPAGCFADVDANTVSLIVACSSEL